MMNRATILPENTTDDGEIKLTAPWGPSSYTSTFNADRSSNNLSVTRWRMPPRSISYDGISLKSGRLKFPRTKSGTESVIVPMHVAKHDVGSDVTQRAQTRTLLDYPVSTTFYPSSPLLPSSKQDIVLKSRDDVAFHVHSNILAEASSNGFGSILFEATSSDNLTDIDDSSVILNVILHAVYDLSVVRLNPSFETVSMAVARMEFYGLSVCQLISPARKLFHWLYSQARHSPIDFYAFAGQYRLEDLAILVSSHLLSFPLYTLTDEIVEQMGPRYFKRLMFLHIDRLQALKKILELPLQPHLQPPFCKDDPQRVWTFTVIETVNIATPDISPQLLASCLKQGMTDISCDPCRAKFAESLNAAAEKWAQVKATI